MSFKLDTATQHSTTAMLLGSGELGKEVAIELMRLGVHVVACDRYDNAPAMQVAHEKIVLNMKDPQALREAIERVKPDYVIPEIEAIATELLMEMEQNEGLHVVPSAKAAFTTMNRKQIRALAAEKLNLPTSPYFFAKSLDEVKSNINRVGYPCIIKPVMSSSGKGQSTIKCEADIEPCWNKACTEGRGGEAEVIVEGFVKFEKEITLLTVSAIDGIHFCKPIFHHQVNGDYHESWQGDSLPEDIQLEAERIARSVVHALGGHGIFGVELFICPGAVHPVLFSELSPRPHDTGMVTMVSQDQSEFALHVRALLGLPVGEITFLAPSASAAVLAEGEGTAIHYEGLEDALRAGGAHAAARIFGKPEVKGERRLGVMLARSTDTQDALAKVKAMRDQIKITISKE
ncbi:MAG: formate-dependent phosphoribosylglycinamide formyltransferase [Anaerobiospirillum succiniciproducens]|uniref:formate-dependent phosphoribosylglycinamide formyltransferase n=1 Tax=Anaerobiospirillum succiniciproducens TaxID=13335 RepID=UPI0023556F74|nr:formate-dependent phosphoribosylglycinamide formyltransferase [Anaerobiospirillum succiniciproducens]MCI6863816.1 formate-dependent phosphoribosylglycinamide formyltransferase [Anaerobiospirillum succiniciproducens]MDY2798062.1 formate-dependent phosphoribosylglycinamide formyltransferase [Anaerobiospirillum succiniciproducens]